MNWPVRAFLGVNAGAGLGVMILIFLTPVDQGLPIWSLPIVAVVGALIAAGSNFCAGYA